MSFESKASKFLFLFQKLKLILTFKGIKLGRIPDAEKAKTLKMLQIENNNINNECVQTDLLKLDCRLTNKTSSGEIDFYCKFFEDFKKKFVLQTKNN